MGIIFAAGPFDIYDKEIFGKTPLWQESFEEDSYFIDNSPGYTGTVY